MSSNGEQVLIAANPKSGASSSRQRVAELREALTNAGFVCSVCQTLQQLRREALSLSGCGKLRAVVSAGGDGTADALANLLPKQIPLAIFPLGTENLLAKHLGITGHIDQAVDMLRANRRTLIDAGSANGTLFLVMLSCGFDAEVVRQMHAIRTGPINRWSYARPICSSLMKYRFPQLSLTLFAGNAADAEPSSRQTTSAAWLFVFNVPRYAAGLKFCPQADPQDGLLDVCLFKRAGIVPGLGYLARLWFGTHQRLSDFTHIRCRGLDVGCATDKHGKPLDIPYQIDGDPGSVLPLEIKVLPERLSVLVPN